MNHTLEKMAEYKIINAGTGKCLNIYGENIASLRKNQNVTLWDDTGTIEQRWIIDSICANAFIRSSVDDKFALNVYRRGNPYNCDVYPLYGNEKDAQVVFVKSGPNYIIKLCHYDLVLTADIAGNGANVYWWKFDQKRYQTWKCVELPPSSGGVQRSSTCISIPQNLNQRYYGNDSIIRQYGCCVCCSCEAASFYAGYPLSLEDMKAAGVYKEDDASCVWSKISQCAFTTFSGKAQKAYYDKIRSEITSGRPVLVYMRGKYQHWVLAYGYNGTGACSADIRVLDPYGDDDTSPTGLSTTLAKSMAVQGAGEICYLVTTRRK